MPAQALCASQSITQLFSARCIPETIGSTWVQDAASATQQCRPTVSGGATLADIRHWPRSACRMHPIGIEHAWTLSTS